MGIDRHSVSFEPRDFDPTILDHGASRSLCVPVLITVKVFWLIARKNIGTYRHTAGTAAHALHPVGGDN